MMELTYRTISGLLVGLAISLMQSSKGHAGPLHEAVAAGDIVALEVHLAGDTDIDETDWMIGSPLHVAVNRGDIDAARTLLEHGANPDAPSELNGATGLGIAATFDDTSMIELFLDHGADIELRDDDGLTPLSRAAKKGMTNAVLFLEDRGADIDARQTGVGTTPLMWASLNGHVEMAETLVDLGAEVDALDDSGFSALMLAAQMQSYSNVGDGSLIELLVASGADPLRKNEFGQTPREYAQSRGASAWSEIAKVLRSIESRD